MMNRRAFLATGVAALAAAQIPLLAFAKQTGEALSKWRKILSPEQFRVLFEAGTERSFTSPLLNEKREGTFICAACYQPLFLSQTKYKSGTGWPSFWKPIDNAVETERDFKLFFPRTEYHCSNCGGHQGHIFDDGPKPTGQRYCNNGVALNFVASNETLPELRA